MTDIMKLADDYAQHKYVNGAEGRGPDAPEARTGYARAALQSAIEALQAENERLTLERDVNKRMRDMHFAEKSALQSRVDAMGKGEPVAYSVGNTLKWHEGKGMTNAQLYAAPKALAPLTQPEVVEAFCNTRHNTQYVSVFDAGVRFAERHHGIGGTP